MVKVYSVQQILSISPVDKNNFSPGEISTDPLDIQSIWRSGNYLNLILLPLVKEGKHIYMAVETELTRHSDGHQTLSLILHHDRNGDEEAFATFRGSKANGIIALSATSMSVVTNSGTLEYRSSIVSKTCAKVILSATLASFQQERNAIGASERAKSDLIFAVLLQALIAEEGDDWITVCENLTIHFVFFASSGHLKF